MHMLAKDISSLPPTHSHSDPKEQLRSTNALGQPAVAAPALPGAAVT